MLQSNAPNTRSDTINRIAEKMLRLEQLNASQAHVHACKSKNQCKLPTPTALHR